jgi:plasmid stabilization system protein ParE
MEESKEKSVVYSREYIVDTDNIYKYGVDTFGIVQAIRYEETIDKLAEELGQNFLIYPECNHIPTKSKMYRNIILESHLFIYRITPQRIEVLRVLHSHSSISKIRSSRSVKL